MDSEYIAKKKLLLDDLESLGLGICIDSPILSKTYPKILEEINWKRKNKRKS